MVTRVEEGPTPRELSAKALELQYVGGDLVWVRGIGPPFAWSRGMVVSWTARGQAVRLFVYRNGHADGPFEVALEDHVYPRFTEEGPANVDCYPTEADLATYRLGWRPQEREVVWTCHGKGAWREAVVMGESPADSVAAHVLEVLVQGRGSDLVTLAEMRPRGAPT